MPVCRLGGWSSFMGISAIVLMVGGGITPLTGRYRLFSLAFLAVIIPVLLSVPDAVEPGKAAKVLLHVRFYLAGLFIVWALDTEKKAKQLLRYLAWLLLFWVMDALLQFGMGTDLLGLKYVQRLNGVFGEHLKLGLLVAVTVPILLVWLKSHTKGVFLLVLACAPVFVVIAGGGRASWLVLAMSLILLLIAEVKKNRKLLMPAIGGSLMVFFFIPVTAYMTSPEIESRVDQTLLLFSGDYEQIDEALSFRLPIWRNALRMVSEHPINGVGARNYRHAYSSYADADDYFLYEADTTPSHPHQLVLEFAAETGVIGVVGLCLFLYLLVSAWLKSSAFNRNLALPIGIGLFVSLFPINTHMALFSSFWGQFIWWLIAIYIALLSIQGSNQNRLS